MNESQLLTWITENDARYHPLAYRFVLEALHYTQCYYQKPRHVSGKELLIGVARLAKERFGDMALLVFQEWGIMTARDFGNIVFNLVEVGEVKKTEDDCIEDFDDSFDLETELSRIEIAQ